MRCCQEQGGESKIRDKALRVTAVPVFVHTPREAYDDLEGIAELRPVRPDARNETYPWPDRIDDKNGIAKEGSSGLGIGDLQGVFVEITRSERVIEELLGVVEQKQRERPDENLNSAKDGRVECAPSTSCECLAGKAVTKPVGSRVREASKPDSSVEAEESEVPETPEKSQKNGTLDSESTRDQQQLDSPSKSDGVMEKLGTDVHSDEFAL